MSKRFRGSFVAKMDTRGRVKIPARYLAILEEQYGNEFYITSLNGDCVLLYPLSVWEKIEEKIERLSVKAPEIDEYITRTSYWGNETEVDSKGRILIQPELRESGKLIGEVRLFGKINYFELWNEDSFKAQSLTGSFTPEKLHRVSQILGESE